MSGHLVDTSVFIAAEQGRPLGDPPPGDARISVATMTELMVGARRAGSKPLRTLRERTLEKATAFIALPYDEAVAGRLADLLVAASRAGRRVAAMDAIIAATAITHGLTVWTQDADFDVLASVEPRLRVSQA